jgi:competence protein ComEC
MKIDRSASDAVRITLDQVVLSRMPLEKTPKRVRILLHGQQGFFDLTPGMTVMLTKHFSPPAGAVELSGFNFKRHVCFYVLADLNIPGLWFLCGVRRINAMRLAGAHPYFEPHSTAVIVANRGLCSGGSDGDGTGLNPLTVQNLRHSNLAHLLAIYGLRMGLFTGFVFAPLRLTLICLPGPIRYGPTKQITACGAILAGAVWPCQAAIGYRKGFYYDVGGVCSTVV